MSKKEKIKEDISIPKYCDVKPSECHCVNGNCPHSKFNYNKKEKNGK